MKITIEPDMDGESEIKPIVYDQIVEFGWIGKLAGTVGDIVPAQLRTHGNFWDVYRLFGEARDRTLMAALHRFGVRNPDGPVD